MTKTKRAIKIQQILTCVFLSLFLCGCIFAQYRFDTWTTDSGLPQNSIRGLIQSKDGYIWGVTNGGIFRFDGVRFKVFNKSSTEGLEESRFLRILEDGDGRLWFLSTTLTLVKYENGQFKTFSTNKEIFGNSIKYNFFTDENGDLIFSSENGHFRFQNGKFIKFEILTSTPQSTIIFSDKESGIWLTENAGNNGKTNTGIRRIVRGNVEQFDFPREQNHSIIPVLYEDRFGNVWVNNTLGNVYRIRHGKIQHFPEMEQIYKLAEDLKGNLWLARIGGFSRLDADQVDAEEIDFSRMYKDSPLEDFSKNSVRTLVFDREGGNWLGTFSRGLIYVQPQTFKAYSKVDWKTELDIVYPIFEDSRKNVWVGIWSYAFIKYDGKDNFRVFDSKSVGSSITAFFEDSKQRLWIGSVGGVGYFKEEEFVKLPFRRTVFDFEEDRDGTIWWGTGSGLVKYDGADIKIFTTEDGLADSYITELLKTKNGDLWIGSRGGLTVYSNKKFQPQTAQDVLGKDHVRSIYEDADGVIWIGTFDDGIIRYKNEVYKRITKNDGLFSENAFCTLEDENGWFWVNTNNGIYRVKKQQLNDFADGKIKDVQSISYNKKDGLINLEGNGGKQPAGITRSNGELWFPTQKGVAIVNPNEIVVNQIPPPVHIEEIFIDKTDIGEYREKIEILPEQNSLEINYTGLSFTNPELVKFRYRLIGLEEYWVEAGTRRTAFYNNLSPGEYTFQVLAANRDGVWNIEGAILKVVKLPHYYQTWWFLILSILTVCAIIALFFYNRISALKRIADTKTAYSRRLIESQEAERKRLASELHDGIGQELIIIKNRALLGIKDDEDRESVTNELERISETATQALVGVREITNNLRPQLLDRLGLTKAIKSMLRKLSGVIEIESEIDSIDNLVSKNEEINIYRIVQESINNVIKHSSAVNVLVEIKHEEKNILMIIKDNGEGFDTTKVKTDKGGLGLVGIKERTQLLGGEFVVDSKVNEGTTILVTIPL